ncbi:MAG: transglycosylase SLT domain-containing protein [Bacteroidetes bacterium]|nr:transglycosylase SLT domain-containing protein [Bacteroidota bacterium]
MRLHIIKRYAVLGLILACNSSAVPGRKEVAGAGCDREIRTVQRPDKATLSYLRIPCIANEGWDTMPEIQFWRRVVSLSEDSSLANVDATRRMLCVYPKKLVDSLDAKGRLDSLRNQTCRRFNLPEGTRIRFTGGKKWFYNYEGVSMKLHRAIEVFDSLGVDPFYAQSVLLIESPGTNKAKSIAGAYGNFQLMPFVARSYGLRVDAYIDERENFDRSAYAAARLIREICVPYARRWCQEYGFAVDEKALWFKLLALHCYNAGSGTVKQAMAVVPRTAQGNTLIKTLWHTSAGYFRSEAQNYSQLALACYLEYEKSVSPHTFVSAKVYNKF